MKIFLIILALIYAGFIICIFIGAHEEDKDSINYNQEEDKRYDK